MSPPHILLLGAHGKVALRLIPLLLARSWSVTALIRDPAQTNAVLASRLRIPLSVTDPGTLDILVRSLEDVKTPEDASLILNAGKSKFDWVIWMAGAGGRGGPPRTNAIDRDASIAFARAITATPSITKYLLLSALSSRRHAAPWWTPEGAAEVKKAADSIAVYTAAKLAADEVLTVLGDARREKEMAGEGAKEGVFSYIILRPGLLSDDEPTGKVQVGKTTARGKISRWDVAAVAAELLGTEGANGWFDLLEGDGSVEGEVKRAVKLGENAVEGEEVEEMKETLKKFGGA